jgi:ribosomal protein L9
VPKHDAYYHLLPASLAVYPTEEFLKKYEKDRELVATKARVSPYAQRTKVELDKLVLDIQMNPNVEWKLTADFISTALRYNVSI